MKVTRQHIIYKSTANAGPDKDKRFFNIARALAKRQYDLTIRRQIFKKSKGIEDFLTLSKALKERYYSALIEFSETMGFEKLSEQTPKRIFEDIIDDNAVLVFEFFSLRLNMKPDFQEIIDNEPEFGFTLAAMEKMDLLKAAIQFGFKFDYNVLLYTGLYRQKFDIIRCLHDSGKIDYKALDQGVINDLFAIAEKENAADVIQSLENLDLARRGTSSGYYLANDLLRGLGIDDPFGE